LTSSGSNKPDFANYIFVRLFGLIGQKSVKFLNQKALITGKSLSEALFFASTNPQYDKRLFTELQVQYMKIPSSNLG
jgi:hypothetical protein